MTKKVKKQESKKDSRAKVETVHRNIRCRNCLIVDGYLEGEKVCRYCGARLFIE